MALEKPGASTGRSEHATPAALPAPRPPRGSCRTSDEAWLLGSRAFYKKVNPFWLDQAARLEAQAASRKRGRVGPQGRKVASLTNKK